MGSQCFLPTFSHIFPEPPISTSQLDYSHQLMSQLPTTFHLKKEEEEEEEEKPPLPSHRPPALVSFLFLCNRTSLKSPRHSLSLLSYFMDARCRFYYELFQIHGKV